MKKISALLLSIVAMFGLTFAAVGTVSALIEVNEELCKGVALDPDTEEACAALTQDSGSDVSNLANTIVNIFSLIVGIIAVIMIIVGGLRYITSGGDTNSVTGAKNTILYAIIGIVIVIFAQTLVKFVINKLTTTGE